MGHEPEAGFVLLFARGVDQYSKRLVVGAVEEMPDEPIKSEIPDPHAQVLLRRKLRDGA